MSTDLTIRKCTVDDIDRIVELHLSLFDPAENFGVRLGRRFLRRTYEYFVVRPETYAYVAELEGNAVGFVAGSLTDYLGKLNRFRRWSALRAFLVRPYVFLRRDFVVHLAKSVSTLLHRRNRARVVRLEQPANRPKGQTAAIASIGTLADASGKRTSDRLLGAAEDYCRSHGAMYLVAGVLRTNTASRFAYRKRKYEEYEIVPHDNGELIIYRLPLFETRT